MRETVRRVTHTSIESYKEITVDLLNHVLSDENYWKIHMIPALQKKFELGLSADETSSETFFSLRQQLISTRTIPFLKRVQEVTGVKIKPDTLADLAEDSAMHQSLELVHADVEKISVRTKFMVLAHTTPTPTHIAPYTRHKHTLHHAHRQSLSPSNNASIEYN